MGSGSHARVLATPPSVTALVEALEAEIRRHVLSALPPDPTGDTAAMDCRTLLHVYGGWRVRHVDQRPRSVYRARELLSSPHLAKYGSALEVIAKRVADGEDLTPHLTTRTRHAYMPGQRPTEPTTRQDRDLLLADWGIHHLHLSTAPHARFSGFTARTDEVLFAAFRGKSAYLIGIHPHPEHHNWAARAILEVAARNWADAGVLHRLEYVIGLSQPA